MQEHSHNFNTRDDDSNNFNAESDEADATLVSPRFDADDARHAHPVVPLDAVRARRYGAKARTTLRSLRHSWPLTTLVVALLAVVAVGGGLAIRRAHSTPPAPASSPASSSISSPASSDAASARQSDAPAHSDADAPAATTPHEDAQAEQHTARTSRDARAERDEKILAPVEVARGAGEDSKGEDAGRRNHGERGDKHRKHEGDERESREGLKHSGKKVPRLVDVITGPPR